MRGERGAKLSTAAEDDGADADAGGAFFDGGGEVVGHAHGELGEGGVAGLVGFEELAQLAEVRASLFAGAGEVAGPGGDGHQAFDAEVGQGCELREEIREGFGGEAVFGFFGRELDLNEDGEGASERARKRR